VQLHVAVEQHDGHHHQAVQECQDKTNFANLVLKHRGVLGDEVDVDVPGPVGDDDHQGEDEEEDEEVRGLGVGPVQQAEHRDQEENSQCDVEISLLPEFLQAGHAQYVEVEADPGKRQDEAEPPQHQTVQLDDPSEGGDGGAVKFQDETLLPLT